MIAHFEKDKSQTRIDRFLKAGTLSPDLLTVPWQLSEPGSFVIETTPILYRRFQLSFLMVASSV